MDKLIEILHSGSHSLVIQFDNDIQIFDGRGVSDLYNLFGKDGFKHNSNLHHIMLADKIVGKGAAALIVAGKVSEIHADVISTSALSLLREHGIKVTFDNEVDHIINREGTDWCPVEKLCYSETSIEIMLNKISKFITERKNHAK